MKEFKTFDDLPQGGKEYRKTKTAWAVQINEPFEVDTKEGKHTGKAGDYLMQGIKGELYPCDQTIFNETYEEVDKTPEQNPELMKELKKDSVDVTPEDEEKTVDEIISESKETKKELDKTTEELNKQTEEILDNKD